MEKEFRTELTLFVEGKQNKKTCYLSNVDLLLPRVNTLQQLLVFLLDPHVLNDAWSLIVRNLAAQALVESLLPHTVLKQRKEIIVNI